jgi:predicted nucleic acid-binding protein
VSQLPARTALADTSLFIAHEQQRPIRAEPPQAIAVSVITVAELHLGVLAAPDDQTRSLRMDTLRQVEELEPLSIDREVAAAWALLRVELRNAGRRMPLNNSWIAATALAHGLPVVTQDDDYDDVPGLAVIQV